MTVKPTLRSTRARSSFVAGIAYVPLAPELRREHPGKGLLIVEFKSGTTRVYLAPSWLYGVLLSPQVSVGRALNRHILRGKVPAEKVN